MPMQWHVGVRSYAMTLAGFSCGVVVMVMDRRWRDPQFQVVVDYFFNKGLSFSYCVDL